MPDLPATSSADAPGPATRTYEEFLEDIKRRIRTAQVRAARAINAELIDVYWQIGQEILRRQAEEGPDLGRPHARCRSSVCRRIFARRSLGPRVLSAEPLSFASARVGVAR